MSGSADKSVTVDILGRESVSQATGRAGAATESFASKVEHLNGRLTELGNVGQTASYAIGNALGNALTRLSSLATNAVKAGFQTAASMEQAQIAFTTLEKSSSKAQGTLKELVDFANSTPFDTTNVVQYGEQLLASGLAADHIRKTLTALGDASGALGLTQDQTSRVMLAWTQIMNRGTVQSGDLLQITEAGIPIWSVMSRALGKPVGTLQDMAQRSQLLAKDVLPALEAQMERDYGGAMGKQAQTLTGLWSTFTSTINTDMANVLKPFEGQLKHGLTVAIHDVGVAALWVQQTGVPALEAFAGVVRDNIGLIEHLAAAVGGGVLALKSMSTVSGVVETLVSLGPVGGTVAAAVIGLGAAFAYLYTSSTPFRTWINGAAQSAFTALQGAVQGFLGYWHGSLEPALAAVGQRLLPKLQAVWRTLVQTFGQGTPYFNTVAAVFKIIGSYVANLLVPYLGFLAGIMLDVLVPAMKVIGWVVDNVWIPAFKFVVAAFANVVSFLVNGAAKAFGWVPGIGPQLQAAAAHFNQFKNDVNSALAGITSNKTVTITVITSPNSPTFGRNTGGVGTSILHGLTSGGGSGLGGSTFGGSSGNASKLFSFLRKRGFTAASAAGVVGTLQGESGTGLNPQALGDHGTSYGIAQWHNSRWANLRSFAAGKHLDWRSLEAQEQFLMSELGQGGAGVSLSKLKGMTNVDAVVAQMVRKFERPADVAGNITRRSKLAENVYTAMTGKTAPGAGTGYEGIADASGGAGDKNARRKRQAQAAWQAAHFVGAGQGFWKNLLKNASSLNSAFATLSNDVAKTGNKHAAAIVAAGRTELLALAKTHDAIIARLKTAQDNLHKLRDSAAQLVQQVRDNVVQSASVAAQDGDYSFGAVIERLQRGVQFATQFASIVGQLRAKGLNNNAVQQLAALSPDQGYEQAISILQSGSGGIAQINRLQAQLGKAGQTLGSTAADSMYGAGTRAAEGLVKGLQAQQKHLEKQMESLGRAMARALKRALGIRSPSRVFAEIGGHIGSGLALGIDGSQPMVRRSVGRLVTVPAGGSIGAGRSTGGGQTIVVENHFHGAVADRRQVVAWVAEGLKQAPVRGVRLA